MAKVTQQTWEQRLKDAWGAYFLTHGGPDKVKRAESVATTAAEWKRMSDADKIAAYLLHVTNDPRGDKRFKEDVTYQLYHLTELAVWMYKRVPLQFLQSQAHQEEGNGRARRRRALGGSVAPPAPTKAQRQLWEKVDWLLDKSNEGTETEPPVVRAQSHDAPPPPPNWPPQP